MQDIAWASSLIGMTAIAVAFLWVAARASGPAADAATIGRTAYRWRTRLFWVVMIVGIALAFATLWQWPIAGYASPAAKPDAVIRAVGHQWRWQLDRDSVRVGELVEFQVSAEDVNHGFAIYRDKHTVVAQTQSMPGYVNKLRVRFTEPGDYEVLCLEYCGLAHHGMRAVIKVRAGT
jgi:cytochrome c oxidase subunit II